LYETYKEAEANWFCKCRFPSKIVFSSQEIIIYISDGDLGAHGNVRDAYMKQKHRMVWERRHGPVGSGMKESGPPELD